MSNQSKFPCDKCSRDDFKSEPGLNLHKSKAHPYVPPPPPKRATETEVGEVENLTLLNGSSLHLGDVVWIERKAVITKITKTEGSKDAETTLRITKKWWTEYEIS